jgi:carbon storage regulator
MLMIKRKVGESITIGGNIVIFVSHTGRNAVEFAVDAPREIEVIRTELLKEKDSKNAE